METCFNIKDSIGSIKGIGPKKEKILKEYNIHTVEDFLYFFPREYQDRRQITNISRLQRGKDALIEGRVLVKKAPPFRYGKSKAPLSLLVEDETGRIEIVFFNARFLSGLFVVNEVYTFYGTPRVNSDRLQMIHPEFAKAGSSEDIRGIIPIYPRIAGISQKEIRKIQNSLRTCYDTIEEWIPEEIIEKERLASLTYSFENIHFPQEGKKTLAAKFRFVYSDMLVFQTGINLIKKGEEGVKEAVDFSCEMGDIFASNLDFELTEDQKKAWISIKEDIEGKGRMNRLLQGDVGSGKTVIAEMAMISASKSGYQSVIMAPTELLAKQHLETFERDLAPYGKKPKLLISSMTKSEKNLVIEGLKDGSIDILIATHAVIQDNIKFNNLGLVITDEQHRFGVNQRRKLSEKGEGANVLVMTATPIPRTLAVILYGDLDTSQIRSMPKGRKPVKTKKVGSLDRNSIYEFAKTEISKGRQAYIVAPLIEDSESVDAKSAESLYEEAKKFFQGVRVDLVHGAMNQEEKDKVMESFAKGETKVLVSTVVIEVGINVPNATVMIIESYERFGLAQLHQLRGRVGRGSRESYCFLVSDTENEIALRRAEVMCSTNDGFEIAEQDLILRGPGEVFGTRQHGASQLILSDMIKHIDVLEKANQDGKKLIEKDPGLDLPEHKGLKERVKLLFGEDIALQL